MAWVKLDDEFYDHPKWVGAPGDSIALWVAMIAWCNRNGSTEGYIPELKTQGLVNVRNLKTTITDLLNRGDPPVLRRVDDGFVIHDYVEYQQPEKVRAIAAKRSAAGKKGARTRWGERARQREHAEAPPPPDHQAIDMTDDMANAIANDMATGCPVPVTRYPSSESPLNMLTSGAAHGEGIEDVISRLSERFTS